MERLTRVADFMTADPHWIAFEETLAHAEQQMKRLRVRHLPVLKDGRLRGIVSERDVALVRSLELDPAEVSVAEALAVEPYTVTADAPLARVARAMAAHRYGCAVVVEGGKVRGILTATDALRALAQLLDLYEPSEDQLSPSQVRELIVAEHLHLRQLLDLALARVRHVLNGAASEDDAASMRESARAAFTALVAHPELEDRRLAPVLETIDAWGKGRASHLRREHVVQRMALERALESLEQAERCTAMEAASVEDILQDILRDMEREEAEILTSDLLSDDITQPSAEGG
jgi:acetoin utilization protein AcuB